MYHLLIIKTGAFSLRCIIFVFGGLIAYSGLFISCGLIDYRPVEITTSPDKPDVILDNDTPEIYIKFNTPVNRIDAENILKITGGGAAVEGDVRWEENTLYWTPAAPLSPGIRYMLLFSGTVNALDGRDERVDITVPFFVLNSQKAPYLAAFSPEDGALTDNHGPEVKLRLVFSEEMNRKSVEENTSIDGQKNLVFTWIDNNTVDVYSKDTYTAFALYKWQVSEKARSIFGVPLAKKTGASFIVGKDTTPPRVKYVYAAKLYEVNPGEYKWQDMGLLSQTGLAKDCAVGIRFTKNMEGAAARNSIRFSPSLPGRAEQISGNTYIYIPDKQPEPEAAYTITVSRDAVCTSGIKLPEDYTSQFCVSIPYLSMLSLELRSGASETVISQDDIQNGAAYQIAARAGMDFQIVINWSEMWTEGAKINAAASVNLQPVFPAGLASVSLVRAKWRTQDKLELIWSGMESAAPGTQKFYKLSVSGGGSGIANGAGSYLKDTMVFYIEVI
ncbi:MAG: hypothetical protein LBG72_01935 [Spirochaetaceae bacterium]|nr:hypothetical protein [Spirochaetaceae bacterium]